MQSLKSLLSSDCGSAPIDFVLITLPTSLLVLPLLAFFGTCQEKISATQVQFELARFAALADVTSSDVEAHRRKVDDNSGLAKFAVDGYCFFESKREIKSQMALWPYPIDFDVFGRACCEAD
jgi:hypothetical protein